MTTLESVVGSWRSTGDVHTLGHLDRVPLVVIVSQPERKEKTDVVSKATFSVSLLRQLLQQVTKGGYMQDTVTRGV